MDLPEHLANYSHQVEQLRQVAELCWRRGWSPAGSGSCSLVVERQPFQMLTTLGHGCRADLKLEDIHIVNHQGHSTSPLADAATVSQETALHTWIAHQFDADAIVQTHSVWSLLLADRYGPLDGVLLEGFELLRRLPDIESRSQAEWLPIVMFYDQTPMLQAVERTMKDRPAEISLPPRAMVLQQMGLLTWADSLDQALSQAEVFEYFCEYLVRKASLG